VIGVDGEGAIDQRTAEDVRKRKDMQWDEIISNQLLWFGAAAVLVLLAGVFAAYRLYKSKPHDATP
jgi:hypothetical protein